MKDSELNIINDRTRISHLLNLLIQTKTQIILRNLLTEYTGVFEEILEDKVIFSTKFKIKTLESTGTLIFSYENQTHYLNSEILLYKGNKYAVTIPDEIFVHIKRKYKRYRISGLNISCNLQLIKSSVNRDIFQSMIYLPIEIQYLEKEMEKEEPNIANVMNLIFDYNKNLSDKIILHLPASKVNNNIVLNFLTKYMKPFLINNTQDQKKYFTNDFPEQMLSYKEYVRLLIKTEKSSEEINKTINTLMEAYKKADVFSVLYIPIVIINQLAGILEVNNNNVSKNIFDLNKINHFRSIGAIINEIILKNKLNCIQEESDINVRDISMSGIGIRVFDSTCIHYLHIDSKLKITLKLDNKPLLDFIGVIKRIIGAKDKYNIGIEIEEILPMNRMNLVDFINNNFERQF